MTDRGTLSVDERAAMSERQGNPYAVVQQADRDRKTLQEWPLRTSTVRSVLMSNLDAECRKRGAPRTDVLREALEKLLAH